MVDPLEHYSPLPAKDKSPQLRVVAPHIKTRRPLRGLFFILGTLLGVVAGLIGTVAYEAKQVPTNYVAPAQIKPTGNQIAITLDNQFLTTNVQQGLASTASSLPVQFQNVTAAGLDGNKLSMNADVPAPVIGIVHVSFTFVPTVTDQGTIQFKNIASQLGQLQLPGLEKQLEQAINKQFADFGKGTLTHGIAYQFVSIEITSKGLMLMAKVN